MSSRSRSSFTRTGPAAFRVSGAAAIPFVLLWLTIVVYWFYLIYRVLVTIQAWPFA